MKNLACWTAVAALCLSATATPAAVAARPDFAARLADLVERGEVTPSRADLYRLYAVKAPERLPAELGVDAAAGRSAAATPGAGSHLARCGVSVLRLARSRLEEMDPDDAMEARGLLGGGAGTQPRPLLRSAGKTANHLLPTWHDTDNFSVQWGPDLTNEDGTAPPRDLDANGVPDVVERWAGYFEESYAKELSFLDPNDPASVPSGTPVATQKVPVLIGNSDPSKSVDDIATNYYALTWSDGVAPLGPSDPVPYIVVNNDLDFVPPNDEGASGAAKIHGAMKITAAHELFHVFHFAWEPVVWRPNEDDWWFEASSTWMEDEVYDGVNDYYQYFGTTGWTVYVEQGLAVPSSDAHYAVRAYGAVVFAKYLAEHVSGRGSMAEVWSWIREGPGRRALPALDAYAASQGFGAGLPELFVGFAGANAVMDYEEGEQYRQRTAEAVPLRKLSLSADSSADRLPVPAYLGATYLKASAAELATDRALGLTGLPAVPWGLSLVAAVGEGYAVVLGRVGPAGATELDPSPAEPWQALYAAVSLLQSVTVDSGGDSGGGGGGGGCFLASARRAAAAEVAPSYRTELLALPVPPDTTGPGAVPSLAGERDAEGRLLVVWTAAVDASGVAGYVVRWRPSGSAVFAGARTLFGANILGAEVGDLDPARSYDVEVFGYDTWGNRGARTTIAVP